MASSTSVITGFTTSIKSYTRVDGILLRPADAVVRYGTLLVIKDSTTNSQYLGMIADVKEETPHPALDVERLRKLLENLAASKASIEDAVRVLEEIISPTQDLIRWSSIMSIDIMVLGQVTDSRLEPYDRPPRPFSRLAYPKPSWLEGLLHGGLDKYEETGLYVGRLSYNPSVRVYLAPGRLTTHLSILGQTGSGKTETVKRLVFEVSRRRTRIGYPKGGIVVFDIAGEYTGYPYGRADVVPLLDAILDPAAYESRPPYDTPSRVTILVPYEASQSRGYMEAIIKQNLQDMACRLASRTGRRIDLLALLAYERFTATITPDEQGCMVSTGKANYPQAYNMLGDSDFLLVALPLPAFMDLESMVELSGTRSEYFPLLVSEVAEALDLYHYDDIYGISLLLEVFRAWHRGLSSKSPQPNPFINVSDLIGAFEGKCKGREPGEYAEKKLYEALTSFFLADRHADRVKVAGRLLFPMLRYLAWLAYRHGYADPSMDSEWKAVCRLLGDREGRILVEERLRSLQAVVRSLGEVERRSLASAVRSLKKLSLMTSDIVDTVLFDKLLWRLMEGFTIVHLAPPSTGDVDVLLATLIRRLFNLHVGDYQEDRLTILVAEEAHNLAPAGEGKASKRALLRVAREGRKWGFSLWLVTQRPAFIDSGILSQTATSILLRTTNPDDISTIKRGVESVASEIVERLPDLEPLRGEALIVGLAAPERRVPLLVMVDKLEAPDSS